ncbi:hypothetical protein KR032_000774 [Drosophila birchii]|nr:hypothetical protein KR032_000774 [Drosophila birchii]
MASNENQTLKLIGLYRSCECLWNPQSPGYLISSVQEDAWRKITRGMNSGLTPDQVKLQVLALRNYYDAECAAIRQSKRKGQNYEPRHSYYKDLMFLSNVLPEETEESKASFCLSQLNGILEDSIVRDDCNQSIYPKNFSKATVSHCTATLSNKTNDTKPADVTFYKLILEPEKPPPSPEMKNGTGTEKNTARSTSGKDNARWYPTAYCVPCKRKRTGCRRCDCTDSDSASSLEPYTPCRPMSVYANKCRSCSSVVRSQGQCSECYNPPSLPKNPCLGLSVEPGPRLCGQPLPNYTPKCRKSNLRDKSCCVSNWKRNKNNMCRRLIAQLEQHEAQIAKCCKKPQKRQNNMCEAEDEHRYNPCSCNSIHSCNEHLSDESDSQDTGNSSYCCTNKRRESGEDRGEVHVCSQGGIPQINHYQQPFGATCMNNNQQDIDYGRYNQQVPDPGNYCDNQQIPEPNTYMSNQIMQNPVRYSNDSQGQQTYSNSQYFQMQAAKPNYYQTQQQFPQCPMNQPQPTNLNKGVQQYSNAAYQQPIDYGRPTIPDQTNVYSGCMENNCGQQPVAAPAPIQRPLTCHSPQQDAQIHQPPCPVCRSPDLDNRYQSDVRAFTEHAPLIGHINGPPEEDDGRCNCHKVRDRQWQSDDIPRNSPTRRYNQGRYSDDEQDIQRRRPNDFDQMEDQRQRVGKKPDRGDCVPRARSYDQMEQTARSRGFYDDYPNRRPSRNNYPERKYDECPSPRKRNEYVTEREMCCPDSVYDKCPPLRRRRPDDCDRRMDQTVCTRKSNPEYRKKPKRKEYVECRNQDCPHLKLPKSYNGAQEPKCCSLPNDDSQCTSCPPRCHIPKDYCGQPSRNWQDREDRIARKTRPPPRSCDYEENRKSTNRERCRPPPPEEIDCECDSEEERILSPKRCPRTRDNRLKRPCQEDKDDSCCLGPKNRQDPGKGKDACDCFCTNETCPYLPRRPPSQEPCAAKRKPKKCCDDERGGKNMSRNQSPARKYPRDDTTDYERPKKISCPLQRPKKKRDCDDCECSSEDNYDQGKCTRCNRCCDGGCRECSHKENCKCCSRRIDRNDFQRNNARSERRYNDLDDDCNCYDDYRAKKCKKKIDECECACSSESDECTRKMDNPRRREESPRCSQKYKSCKEFEYKRPTNKTISPCRQSKGFDKYESDCDCSSPPKRCDSKPSPRKSECKSKGNDQYESEWDCFCAYDDKELRNFRKSPPWGPRPRCRNDQRDQKNETTRYLDYRAEKTVCRSRKPTTCQNKCPPSVKDIVSDENEFDYCECECKCNEDNATLKAKCDQCEDLCACDCDAPFEPQITQSNKRNPAGNGSAFDDKVGIEAALKLDTANSPWQGSYKVNIDLPFSEETKILQAPQCVLLPCKKKKLRPGSAGPSKSSRSSKLKSTPASPTRSSALSKTQPGETTKKRTTSLSNGRRTAQGGARRTTDTSAAANSKLSHDINSASYFICKLQDDDKSQQYLIVVPKEQIERTESRQDDPGQGSWKQLHCLRQSSGFQGVSWANPASNSVFSSPPFNPMEKNSKLSSYEMQPGMTDTTMGIVKNYLQQTMLARCPGLKRIIQPVMRCPPIDRSSNKANPAVLTESRTVLLTNKPLQNLSLPKDKEEVIVLLPPIAGFRSSKNSFNTDAVEVERITVQSSGTDVKSEPTPTKPLPPKPPMKPKRKALL